MSLPSLIELARLDLERRHLEVEMRREMYERKVSLITRIGILVPVLVALLGLGGVLWSVRSQSESSRNLQRRAATADFQTHAAEIVMDTTSPVEAYGRARALAALFPDQLSPDFAATFNPERFSNREEFDRGQRVEAKKELLGLIADHPDQRRALITLWRQLFPGDVWTDDIGRP